MRIHVYRSAGCFGRPAEATIETGGSTDPQIQAEDRILEAMATTAMLAQPKRPGGHSSAPMVSLTIEHAGGTFRRTYDSIAMPSAVSALTAAVWELAEQRGIGGIGGGREIA